MDRRAYLRAVGGLSTVGLAGCSGLVAEQGTGNQSYDVGMSSSAFRPARIEIDPGETVVWRNTSSHAHTVTAYEESIPEDATYFASGGFDNQSDAETGWIEGTNGALYQGDEYEWTFEVPGEHHYFCVPHEQAGMAGTVTVSGD
ncbi:Plastocyanin [Halomicrobium zhouii]|uniref:Plastocyanin n=1 Tax=Halomicrobium zhouii TaxID=767519 RepID=A0A1I6KTM1_9EURY|nr:plastocyanin/azurin family copper-binding protein [Halomicrobium zhouii]SFR94534.1 Plastocyanin [Halomicrobium zhouii]